MFLLVDTNFFSIFSDIFQSGSCASVQWKRIFQYPLPGGCKRIFYLQIQFFFFFWLELFLLILEIISVIKRQRYFFSSTGNVYFNEILHSGQWKRIFRLVETFLFSEVFLQVKTVTETSGSQLQKKEHALTNVTDFRASRTHFLSFFQTTVNCCLWKQFILQFKHIFQ